MSLKSMAAAFMTAFSRPAHYDEREIVPIKESAKPTVTLSSRSLVQKIEEAKKELPAVMKFKEEALAKNQAALDELAKLKGKPQLKWEPMWHAEKKWRIIE